MKIKQVSVKVTVRGNSVSLTTTDIKDGDDPDAVLQKLQRKAVQLLRAMERNNKQIDTANNSFLEECFEQIRGVL